MTMLVDTSVLAELTRPAPNPGVAAWAKRAGEPALSVVTLEELYRAIGATGDGDVRAWLDAFAARSRVLPVTLEIARHAGLLRAQLAAQGMRRPQADLMVAATAAVHALTVVTRRPRDFDGCGVPVLDPWRAAP